MGLGECLGNWSDTTYSDDFTNAWYFLFSHGYQGEDWKQSNEFFGLAVRDGDVAPVSEPIPALSSQLQLTLVASMMAAVMWVWRRQTGEI